MNLFDYIRMQGTDLKNEKALTTLPDQLVDMLISRYFRDRVNPWFMKVSDTKELKCYVLATKCRTVEVFHEVLKEYYNEHREPV